jgi:pyruvate dehydrogenase E2 component (dihydrolipoamide acetyltransferase)
MSERVTMPALGESVTEGTVTRWLKNVGDTVEVDEPLLEVSTDKVDTEIPSPVSGTLLEILAQEDETVEVGADLAVIGEASESGGGEEQQDDSGAQDDQSSADVGQTDESPQEAQEPADQGGAEEPADQGGAEEQEQQEQAPQAGTDSGDGEGETVTMPALGESVTEGTVTRWLKSEGDTVEVDEPLLEVSTDKVDTEIPSPVAGVLTKILAGEDETVEVGAPLAVIGGSGGGGGAAAPAAEAQQEEQPEPEQSEPEPAAEDPAAEDTTEAAEAKQDEAAADADTELAEEAQVQTEGAEESAQRSEEQSTTPEPQQAQPAQGVGTEAAAEESGGGGDVSAYVTPLVRKLAAQHGVDLSTLKGTGVGGRIRKQDVLDAARKAQEAQEAKKSEGAPAAEAEPAKAAAPSAAPSGRGSDALQATQAKRGSREKMSRLRKVIAKRMVESLQTSAQLTTVVEVDVTKVARLRTKVKDEFQRREGVKLSFLPFFAMATIEALKQHPNLNASVEDDEIIYHAQENLGIAVDTEKGLIVPVIKDAGDLNIAGLARKIADLAERTRTNKISPDELGGGTFTLTNTGSRGALFDTPIINQPQVGILGTGAVVKRPVVVTDEDGGETIAIRSMAYLALTYDHRIVDGADAARFLTTVKERLEEGSFEV